MWFRVGSVANLRARAPAPRRSLPNWAAAVFASPLGRNADFCSRPCSRQARRITRPEAAIFGHCTIPESSDFAWGVSRNGVRPPGGSVVLGPTRPSSFLRHSSRETTTFALPHTLEFPANARFAKAPKSKFRDTPQAESLLLGFSRAPRATPTKAPLEWAAGRCAVLFGSQRGRK